MDILNGSYYFLHNKLSFIFCYRLSYNKRVTGCRKRSFHSILWLGSTMSIFLKTSSIYGLTRCGKDTGSFFIFLSKSIIFPAVNGTLHKWINTFQKEVHKKLLQLTKYQLCCYNSDGPILLVPYLKVILKWFILANPKILII